MKKLFVTAALAMMVGITSFAADSKKVSQRVLAAFEKEFTTATNVSWEMLKDEDIAHASFIYANEVMEAYYTTEGELLAVARYLSQDRLPLLVAKTLHTEFGKYQIKSASEYMGADATSYIVTLESEKHSVVVRIYSNGSSAIIKKNKKS